MVCMVRVWYMFTYVTHVRKQQSKSGVSSLTLNRGLFSEEGPLTETGVCRLARLAAHKAPGIDLVLPPLLWACRKTPLSMAIYKAAPEPKRVFMLG